MRLSAFRKAVAAEFGVAQGGVILRDHWLVQFAATADAALAAGHSTREVWEALCDDFAVPLERRYGRGLDDPKK